jgi:hypothetical protein
MWFSLDLGLHKSPSQSFVIFEGIFLEVYALIYINFSFDFLGLDNVYF